VCDIALMEQVGEHGQIMGKNFSYRKCSIFGGFQRDPQKIMCNGYCVKVLVGLDFCTFASEVPT
jgi:hypothetical protein